MKGLRLQRGMRIGGGRSIRILAPALLTMCTLAVLSVPASAHVELERSEPAAGAVLDTPPVEVFLRFTGEIEEGTISIDVRDPGGDDVTAGQTQSGGRAAAVNLAPLTQKGVYRVRYKGIAADGHELQGRLRFRLRLAAAPSPTTVAEPTATAPASPTPRATGVPTPPPTAPAVERRAVPWWPFALLLGVAALIGVTLFRRR